MSMLTLLIIFFFMSMATVGLMIYLDMRPYVAQPPQLNHLDGSENVTTADATASHQEDKATGEIKANASVNGNGKAEASAELGHEFQFNGKERKRFNLAIYYGYRAHVQVDEGPAQSRALIQAALLPESTNEVLDEVLAEVGVKDSPEGNDLTFDIQKIPVALEPKQKCKAFLKVTAYAESLDETKKARCQTRIVGKITQVRLTPT
jgi:hypothetical protein